MLRLFYGWTEDELLEELKIAQKAIASGVTIISTGTAGTSTGAQVAHTPVERFNMIAKALYELDPVKYEIFENSNQYQVAPIFSSSSRSY